MKSTLSLAVVSLLSVLSTTASAATVNKVRMATRQTPTYTVQVVTSDGVSTSLFPDGVGNIYDTFDPSVTFLTSATLYNVEDNVQCVVSDIRGYQVRAFGGPNQDVDSITLVPADGKQVYSLFCKPTQ